MSKQRKIILYIAISVDGYIAKENGEIDWLHESESQGIGDNGYTDFYETIDTVLLGKKTYDQVLTLVDNFPYQDKTCYVFTSSKTTNTEYVQFVNGDVGSFTRRLKLMSGKDIWLVGGADLVDGFLKESLVDELIITVIPILLGEGISLFKGKNTEKKLKLIHTTCYGEFVQLHYRVLS